ncbi:DUF1636 family protein [Oceaniglobus indicus]|uniref:DUF1636 family protein n=1 Tax=Oceaniglobus indicus TaxID=2047749 RepID=UPI000C182B44|nr:DUF1636 family protein [Oceaniglobus indicus]
MGDEIVICETCRSGVDAGAALADALAASCPSGFTLRRVECMSMCANPVSVAFRGDGRATYLFSGLNAGDLADIAAFGALYRAAPKGWIEDARPAGRLRHCLVGRVPV